MIFYIFYDILFETHSCVDFTEDMVHQCSIILSSGLCKIFIWSNLHSKIKNRGESVYTLIIYFNN